MDRPATRRHRSRTRFLPTAERLEALELPSGILPAYIDLTATPVAAGVKSSLAASAPASGRQGGVVNALVAVPEAGGDVAVAGVMTLRYRVRLLPTLVSPFYSPTNSFTMRVSFATSLDDPSPGDVSVGYSTNLIPFGASVRTRVADGLVALLHRDRAAILAVAR
jgi:hypothetical protein